MEDKVTIEIDENIKKQTIKCEKDFACLSSKTHKLCEVTHLVHEKIVFIECQDNKQCSYKSFFGFNSYICNCPIRREIYRKYKI